MNSSLRIFLWFRVGHADVWAFAAGPLDVSGVLLLLVSMGHSLLLGAVGSAAVGIGRLRGVVEGAEGLGGRH